MGKQAWLIPVLAIFVLVCEGAEFGQRGVPLTCTDTPSCEGPVIATWDSPDCQGTPYSVIKYLRNPSVSFSCSLVDSANGVYRKSVIDGHYFHNNTHWKSDCSDLPVEWSSIKMRTCISLFRDQSFAVFPNISDGTITTGTPNPGGLPLAGPTFPSNDARDCRFDNCLDLQVIHVQKENPSDCTGNSYPIGTGIGWVLDACYRHDMELGRLAVNTKVQCTPDALLISSWPRQCENGAPVWVSAIRMDPAATNETLAVSVCSPTSSLPLIACKNPRIPSITPGSPIPPGGPYYPIAPFVDTYPPVAAVPSLALPSLLLAATTLIYMLFV